MAKEERKLSMAEFAKQLNKEYKMDNLVIQADIVPSYKRLTTGLLGMDYVLGGGLPYGRIAVFAGQEHSGKTTAACAQLGAYQKENPDKVCLYVDCEHSLDLNFQAMMNGIDLTKLFYYSPVGQTGEQILADILRFQDTEDIGMIILDSIPALIPAVNVENDFEKDMGQRGTMAKPLHKFLNTMTDKVNAVGNILILINQVREAGKTFTGATIYTEPGGAAPKYLASVKVRFGKRAFMKDGEEMASADGEGSDGFRLKFKITKNKTFNCSRGGGFITYNYEHGVCDVDDLLDIALKFDFIKRVNNVTYELVNLSTGEVITDSATGEVLRGKKQYIIDYLNEHANFRAKYVQMVKHFISAVNDQSLLSKEEGKAIDSEEHSVMVNEQTEEQYLRQQEAEEAKAKQILLEGK